MTTNTRKTAADLTTHVGKLVIADASGFLMVNNSAGTAVLGVLTKVYTIGGTQFGEYTDGPTIQGMISDASIIIVGGTVEADALGQVTKFVGGKTVGVAVTAGTGVGKAILVQPFASGAT